VSPGVALALEFGFILGLGDHGCAEPADDQALDARKDLDPREVAETRRSR
jgi:hypothetical protein